MDQQNVTQMEVPSLRKIVAATVAALIVAGVILVTLLQSILSVMQMAEFGRQVIYGVVIIGMLLLYGRERLLR